MKKGGFGIVSLRQREWGSGVEALLLGCSVAFKAGQSFPFGGKGIPLL